jgi:hypothetical protein
LLQSAGYNCQELDYWAYGLKRRWNKTFSKENSFMYK